MLSHDRLAKDRSAMKRSIREDQINRAYSHDIEEHEAAQIVSGICQQAQQRDREES
ncbi:hypothetical protein BD1_57 [Octadecabacter Antarctic BD virus 1]|nr:hypothetical protein BD1_57 [Octadecabacter Antarctic BD virus 1]